MVVSVQSPSDLVVSALDWNGSDESTADILDMIEHAFVAADPLDFGHGLSDIVAHRRELEEEGRLSLLLTKALFMDIRTKLENREYLGAVARSLQEAANSTERAVEAIVDGDTESVLRSADRARRLLEAAAAAGRTEERGLSSEEQRSLDLFDWAGAIQFSLAVIANGGAEQTSYERSPKSVDRVGGAVEAAAGAIQLNIVENDELLDYVKELEHWVSIVELQLRGAAVERNSAVEELRRAKFRISELEALRDQLRAQLHQSEWDRERLLMAAQSTKRAASWFRAMTASAVGTILGSLAAGSATGPPPTPPTMHESVVEVNIACDHLITVVEAELPDTE